MNRDTKRTSIKRGFKASAFFKQTSLYDVVQPHPTAKVFLSFLNSQNTKVAVSRREETYYNRKKKTKVSENTLSPQQDMCLSSPLKKGGGGSIF